MDLKVQKGVPMAPDVSAASGADPSAPEHADSMDTYAVSPARVAAPELVQIRSDVGLFEREPFPLSILYIFRNDGSSGMADEIFFVTLSRYLGSYSDIFDGRVTAEYQVRHQPWQNILAQMAKKGGYQDIYGILMWDLERRTKDFKSEKLQQYLGPLQVIFQDTTTSDEVKEIIENMMEDFFPNASHLIRMIARQSDLLSDLNGVVEHFSPLIEGNSRHFESESELDNILWGEINKYLIGLYKLAQPINPALLLDPDNALQLLFTHGPKNFLVASILGDKVDWAVLPSFLQDNLKDDMKEWINTLSPHDRGLALILVITAHATRDEALAVFLRTLAASPNRSAPTEKLTQKLSQFKDLEFVRSSDPIFADKPVQLTAETLERTPVLPGTHFENLIRGGFKPTPFMSIKLMMEPLEAARAFGNVFKKGAKAKSRLFITKESWPAAVRLMGMELIAMFLDEGDSEIWSRVAYLAKRGSSEIEAQEIVRFYRQYRPMGDYVVDQLISLIGPLFKAKYAKAVVVKKEWKTQDSKKILYAIGSKLGSKFKKTFEDLCMAVFSVSEHTPTEIESLLREISLNPHLKSNLETIVSDPNYADTTVDQKVYFLRELSEWKLEVLKNHYLDWLLVKDESFAPLKTALEDIVSDVVRLDALSSQDDTSILWRKIMASNKELETPLRRMVILALSRDGDLFEKLPEFLSQLATEKKSWDMVQKFAELNDTGVVGLAHRAFLETLDSMDPLDWVGPKGRIYWESIFKGVPHDDLVREVRGRQEMALIDANPDAHIDPEYYRSRTFTFRELTQTTRNARSLSKIPAIMFPDLLQASELALFNREIKREFAQDSDKRTFLRHMLASHTESPANVLGLMYWLTGLRRTSDVGNFQEIVNNHLSEYLDLARRYSLRISGDVLYTFLDRTQKTVDELTAAFMHAQQGDWIHFIPPSLQKRNHSPDLMIVSPDGGVKLVEVKSMVWTGLYTPIPDWLIKRLDKANKQLENFLPSQNIRRIFHGNVTFDSATQKANFLEQLIQHLESVAYSHIDQVVLLMSPRIVREELSPEIIKIELKTKPTRDKENRYGGFRAARLADWMHLNERADLREVAPIQALAADASPSRMIELKPHNILQVVRQESFDARPDSTRISPLEAISMGVYNPPVNLSQIGLLRVGMPAGVPLGMPMR